MKSLTTDRRTRAQLRGTCIVPLLTPFTPDGEIDAPALGRIIDHVAAGGCQGIMVAGTTGEFASLSVRTRLRLMELTQERARGRLLVFGGIGDTSFAHSVELGREFLRLGAHAVVGNLPSYYPLTAPWMENYFTRLADAVAGPTYLYNIPQTTRQSIPLDVVERLSHHPLIPGIKDSEPNAERQEQVSRLFRERTDFAVFCGNIAFTSAAVRAGADGCVAGGGNFAPRAVRELMDALVAGSAEASALQRRLDAINSIFQLEMPTLSHQLVALKAIMELLGLSSRAMALPLLPAGSAEVEALRQRLRTAGILE